MQAAIAESVATDMQYNNARLFNSVDELVRKLQFLDTQYWTLIKNSELVTIREILLQHSYIIFLLTMRLCFQMNFATQDTALNKQRK